MESRYFSPIPNKVYSNINGMNYICLASKGQCDGIFQAMTKSKWTFTAHGCHVFDNGKIEWNHSSDGHFEGVFK